MIIVSTENFKKDLEKIRDVSILKRAQQAIQKLREADSLHEISNIKAIKGWPTFYRIRFGDFRIGFQLTDKNEVMLFAIDHRSKIYNFFPKNLA